MNSSSNQQVPKKNIPPLKKRKEKFLTEFYRVSSSGDRSLVASQSTTNEDLHTKPGKNPVNSGKIEVLSASLNRLELGYRVLLGFPWFRLPGRRWLVADLSKANEDLQTSRNPIEIGEKVLPSLPFFFYRFFRVHLSGGRWLDAGHSTTNQTRRSTAIASPKDNVPQRNQKKKSSRTFLEKNRF